MVPTGSEQQVRADDTPAHLRCRRGWHRGATLTRSCTRRRTRVGTRTRVVLLPPHHPRSWCQWQSVHTLFLHAVGYGVPCPSLRQPLVREAALLCTAGRRAHCRHAPRTGMATLRQPPKLSSRLPNPQHAPSDEPPPAPPLCALPPRPLLPPPPLAQTAARGGLAVAPPTSPATDASGGDTRSSPAPAPHPTASTSDSTAVRPVPTSSLVSLPGG